MTSRILHILSQRPSRTGSGVTLDSLVRLADESGWQQSAIVGVPADELQPTVGGLAGEHIHPVFFGSRAPARGPMLEFPVPGMSDVMPYPSSVWSDLDAPSLAKYRQIWSEHIRQVIESTRPDLVHSNHIWLMSSLLKDVAPNLPVVTTCHATGLRQLELCPRLADEVIAGCRRNDHFFVLRRDHRDQLAAILKVPAARITICGAGFREDLFHPAAAGVVSAEFRTGNWLYVGKYSAAKGLPQLLESFAHALAIRPDLRLHIAGSGAGAEAERLQHQMEAMAPAVVLHGQLDQRTLSHLMVRCSLCVLPSFYEGVPLVLVEAAACGCRIVSTDLPGVREQLAPTLGDTLRMVPLPDLDGIDTPRPENLPVFVDSLLVALLAAEDAGPAPGTLDLREFTWEAVFERVAGRWRELLGTDLPDTN